MCTCVSVCGMLGVRVCVCVWQSEYVCEHEYMCAQVLMEAQKGLMNYDNQGMSILGKPALVH